MGIERFVLPACADLVRLTSEMCLGGTPFERSQETIRLAARSVQQRCSIPRGVGVLVRALGGGDRRQGRLLVVARLCSMLGVCALVGLGDELQVSCTPLLRVYSAHRCAAGPHVAAISEQCVRECVDAFR